MKKIVLLGLFVSAAFSQAQSFIQAYQNRANDVQQTNINTLLQEFGNMGIKRTGTTNNTTALNWIRNKYIGYGYQTSQIEEQPFSFTQGGTTINSKNLVITKVGTLYPNTYVIVCGHFDSVTGPGVNDNGSGTASILEAARILRNVPTEYSIKFIHFSGEEQGLYGSYAYVDNIVNGTNPKMNIKLVFNLDQVGGKASNVNNTIYCDVDQSAPNSNNAASQDMATQLATCTALYSPLQTAYDPAYSTDYVPFMQNGEVVTGFYEYTRSYTEHTVNDTYGNVDKTYVYNVAKAGVGAIQHFAIASTLLGLDETQNTDTDFTLYPNPTSDILQLDLPSNAKGDYIFEAHDMSGKLVMTKKNSKSINISSLEKGIYIGTVTYDDGKYFKKKFIVKK